MVKHSIFKFVSWLMVSALLLSGCGAPTPIAETLTPAAIKPTPLIGNLLGVPTSVAPGTEIPVLIDQVEYSEPLQFEWSVLPEKGEIRGQGTRKIQYRAPEDPGIYLINVKVTSGSYSKEISGMVTVTGTASVTPTPTTGLTPSEPPAATPTLPLASTPPGSPPVASLPCSTPVKASLTPLTFGDGCPLESALGDVYYCPSQADKFVASVDLRGLLPNRSYRFAVQAADGAARVETDGLLLQSCNQKTERGDAYCDKTLNLTDGSGTLQQLFSISLKQGSYVPKFLLKDADNKDKKFCVTMNNDEPGNFAVEQPIAFQKGISFVTWQSGAFQTTDADKALEALAATGADWIALVVTGYQDSVSATSIQYVTPKTATDADLKHVFEFARKRGLKILLKPHVDLPDGDSHWRGEIGANFQDADWQTWFASYRDFIGHYAALAAQNEDVVQVFSVGTELVTASARETEWGQVLQDVRARYKGKLVYASNFNEPSRNWWGNLDYIGVDAYFPLKTSSDAPSVDELKAAWQPNLKILENLYQQYSRPLIITEIGYVSVHGAHAAPYQYAYGKEIPKDMAEQENLYRAALATLWEKDWLAGIYWWNWLTNPNQGGPNDRDYTPHGKPAEKVLAEYYHGEGEVQTTTPTAPQIIEPLIPYSDSGSCQVPGLSGEVEYAAPASGKFQATVRLAGLKQNHTYILSINCQPGTASCELLKKGHRCQVYLEEGYCDINAGVTDAKGALQSYIQLLLPPGDYAVKFFVKDPQEKYCIPLYNNDPYPISVLK